MAIGVTLTSHAHKLQVSDPSAARDIVAEGGHLIADYGSFKLFETPRANGILRDDYNLILLNSGVIDTSRVSAGSLTARDGLCLVQFAGPVEPSWRGSLLATGIKIIDYIPYNTYLVSGPASTIESFAKTNPFVQWHSDYTAARKIHPLARAATNGEFSIQLSTDDNANSETLALLKGKSRRFAHYINVEAQATTAELDTIAARPDVLSIQPHSRPRKLCERQDQIAAGNLSGTVPSGPGYLAWLESKGFTQAQFDASGFVVDISDSGIDNGTTSPNHFGLYENGNTSAPSRVAYSRLEGTANSGSTLAGCDGHGTLVSHIVCGFDNGTNFPFADGSGFNYGLGVCPFARVGASVIFDPFYYTSPTNSVLMSDAYASGARISNNSWDYEDGFGVYGSESQEFDALVRDAQSGVPGNQEMVIVFAIGNTAGAGTIMPPATAKNVITVGGAQSVQVIGGEDECDVGDDQAENANQMDSSSSDGPCADGRRKPDLVAPATHISGGVIQISDPGPNGDADPCFTLAWSNGDSSICGGTDGPFFPAGQEFYTTSDGTSFAAPCVSGACALLRQYFINQSLPPPSPAMTKAYIMNSARYLTGPGGNLWSDVQGMGEVNLGAAFDTTPRFLRDEVSSDTFTATGQTRVFQGVVANTNLPLRVTLAWTDAPGSTTGAAWNNDLDLTVAIAGQTYLGNVFSGQWSALGGVPDSTNNVESVFLPSGAFGPFIVTVTAANINSIGVPNSTNALLQDFALVIDNTIVPPVILHPQIIGTNFIFSFPSQTNQSYTIEYNTVLTNSSWTTVQSLTGNGSVVSITNSIIGSAAYYRVLSP